MIELINEHGVPLSDEVREMDTWFDYFRRELGIDLFPYVYDPMSGDAPDREELEASGMMEEDIEELLHTSKDDFHDPAELRGAFEKLLEFAQGLPTSKEAKLLVKELRQLLEGCDRAIKSGDKVQLLSDSEDDDEPDYDDKEEEEREDDED